MEDGELSPEKCRMEYFIVFLLVAAYTVAGIFGVIFFLAIAPKGTDIIHFLLGRGQLFSGLFWLILIGCVLNIFLTIRFYQQFQNAPKESPLIVPSLIVAAYNASVIGVTWFLTHVDWYDL